MSDDEYQRSLDGALAAKAARSLLINEDLEGSVNLEETEIPSRDGDLLGNLRGSKTTLEVQKIETSFPGERSEAKVPETDLHAARSSQEREKFFLQVVPDNYEVTRCLGRGHNGVVFAAQDVSSGQGVAIKFLEQQKAGHDGRRIREIAAHGWLPPHENIVRLLSRELHSAGGYDYFVMELCDTSLEAWIEETAQNRKLNQGTTDSRPSPALPAVNALRMLHELCDALMTLHRFGVTHRDIKPSNVLLRRRPDASIDSVFPYSVKLADFGVADIKVVETERLYNVSVGVSRDFEYSIEDDYRSAVATVFFAWLGESNWQKKKVRNRLFMDQGFLVAVSQLLLTPEDRAFHDFLERALPLPRQQRLNGVIPFEEAPRVLEQLGQELGLVPSLRMKTPIGGTDLDEGLDNDSKLNLWAHFALSAVSGRRYAKDFDAARGYLDWVRFVFEKYHRDVPDSLLSEFEFQLASTENLPKLQQTVRDYASAVTAVPPLSEEEMKSARQDVTMAIQQMKDRLRTGRMHSNRAERDLPAAATTTVHVRPIAGANLEALTTLESVKFLRLCEQNKRAMTVAEEGVANLRLSLSQFQGAASSDDAFEKLGEERTRRLHRTAFQHCRNMYLLFREALAISHESQDKSKTRRLSEEAVEVCQQGVVHVDSSYEPPKSDRLEMRRCLAEALYIAGRYSDSRLQCRQIYDEFGGVDPLRSATLRVLAIWVASLRSLQDEEFELGFVCGILTTIHREAAVALSGNPNAVSNARSFLASQSDPLLPSPLLPPNHLVQSAAEKALDAIENPRVSTK